MGDEPVVEIVNDALAIAQHVTKFLEDNAAVSYLQAIEKLSLEDWKGCKVHLDGVNRSNRSWKEGHIRDVVEIFCNSDIKTVFLLRDLSLCPGFSQLAVELGSYQASTLYTVSHVSRVSSRTNNSSLSDTFMQQQSTSYAQQNGNPINTDQQSTHKAGVNRDNSALPQSSKWGEKRGGNQGNTHAQNRNNRSTARTYYCGSNQSVNKEKKQPLTSVCLAVKSGNDETCESLKEELKQWKHCNLQAELVTAAAHYTLFRVKFNIPTALKDTWKDASVWPSRMIASQWRGNPTSILKTPEQRIYRKSIYIGNLSPAISLEQINNNVKRIYVEEIQANVVHTVETLMNQEATANRMNKSVCIVLTSHPGKTLNNVTLREDDYPYSMRRNIRVWRGRPPWPDHHEQVKPILDLPWY